MPTIVKKALLLLTNTLFLLNCCCAMEREWSPEKLGHLNTDLTTILANFRTFFPKPNIFKLITRQETTPQQIIEYLATNPDDVNDFWVHDGITQTPLAFFLQQHNFEMALDLAQRPKLDTTWQQHHEPNIFLNYLQLLYYSARDVAEEQQRSPQKTPQFQLVLQIAQALASRILASYLVETHKQLTPPDVPRGVLAQEICTIIEQELEQRKSI